MVSRTRTMTSGAAHGEYTSTFPPGHLLEPRSITRPTSFHKVVDTVAPGDNQVFTVDHFEDAEGSASGGPVNGSVINWPCVDPSNTVCQNGVAHSVTGASSDAWLITQLIAMTNPSRADIDLPVFVAELRDLPHLIKLKGDNLIKDVARANLSYRFGLAPLMSDLQKLFSFHDTVDRRYRELHRLYNGGLRRTVMLERNSGRGTRSVAYTPLNIYNNYTVTLSSVDYVTEQVVRGHIRWKPTGLPPKGDQAMRSLAMRAALGLYINPAAAWELIPFSWLSDWFLGIGNYLNASRNLIPATPYGASIMRESKTSGVFKSNTGGAQASSMSVSACRLTHTTKSRVPISPTPTITARMPWLSPGQWSILASLYALKGGGYKLPKLLKVY